MRQTFRRMGLLGDVLASGTLAGVASIINVASVFLFAHAMDPAAFGLLSTCRRVVAFFAPLANLNGHLAVSRYLGYYATEHRRRSAVFAVGFWLLLISIPLSAGLFLLVHTFGSQVEWVRTLTPAVWCATALLTITTSAGLVTFSVLRGYGHPQSANMHQLYFVTILLAVGLAAGRLGVAAQLFITAGASVAVSLGYLARMAYLHRTEIQWPARRELWTALRETARYSLPRIADGPCQAALTLVAVVAAPAIGGMALAGQMHISQTMVRMTEVAIVPLSVIFLPLAARQARAGQLDTLRRQAQIILDSVLWIGMLLTPQAMAWAACVLHAVFGNKYAGAETLLLVTLPAIVPYMIYAGFRSFIDGYSVRPVNFLHLALSLAVVIAGSLVLGRTWGGVGLAAAYTAGVTCLGIATLAYVYRQFQVTPWHRANAIALALSLAFGGAAYAAARAVASRPTAIVILAAAISQLAAGAALILVGRRTGHPVVQYVDSRLRRAREPAGAPAAATESRAATRPHNPGAAETAPEVAELGGIR